MHHPDIEERLATPLQIVGLIYLTYQNLSPQAHLNKAT
jgi:hypothetical protein